VPSFTARLADGWERGLEFLPLAIVPAVTTLLATDNIERVATFDGWHFGLKLGLPVTVVNLWQFVSLPNQAVGVGLPLPEALPLVLVVLPLGIVVQAALSAGYFGSIATALERGSFEFVESIRRHFVAFLVYTVIPVAVVAPVVILGLANSRLVLPIVLLLVVAFLVASYLFYAAPYLVVLRDTDIVSALRASYSLATEGGPYLRYAAAYAGFVLALSAVATAVVVNLGLIGVAVGVVASAPVGLACNAATMRFVADIDPESPSLGEGAAERPHHVEP
jgi:hypothetical protein